MYVIDPALFLIKMIASFSNASERRKLQIVSALSLTQSMSLCV